MYWDRANNNKEGILVFGCQRQACRQLTYLYLGDIFERSITAVRIHRDLAANVSLSYFVL